MNKEDIKIYDILKSNQIQSVRRIEILDRILGLVKESEHKTHSRALNESIIRRFKKSEVNDILKELCKYDSEIKNVNEAEDCLVEISTYMKMFRRNERNIENIRELEIDVAVELTKAIKIISRSYNDRQYAS